MIKRHVRCHSCCSSTWLLVLRPSGQLPSICQTGERRSACYWFLGLLQAPDLRSVSTAHQASLAQLCKTCWPHTAVSCRYCNALCWWDSCMTLAPPADFGEPKRMDVRATRSWSDTATQHQAHSSAILAGQHGPVNQEGLSCVSLGMPTGQPQQSWYGCVYGLSWSCDRQNTEVRPPTQAAYLL